MRKFLCFILAVIMVFPVCAFADEGSERLTIYLIDETSFDKFLAEPSAAAVKENLGHNPETFERPAAQNRIGNPTVLADEKFFNIFGSVKNIEKTFADNGVVCNIKNFVIFIPSETYLSYNPFITLFAETDSGNYFITGTPYFSYSDEGGYKEYFEITVYSQDEYCSKFGLKTGKAEVGAKVISDNVTFRNTVVHIPFRAVAESLGCDVSWDETRKAAVFSKDGNEFMLKTDDYYAIVRAEDADEQRSFPPDGVMPYVEIVEGRIIVDDNIMKDVMAATGSSMVIDYDNFTVKIS